MKNHDSDKAKADRPKAPRLPVLKPEQLAEVTGGAGYGSYSWRMFNPQPEPPAEEQQMVVEDLDIFGFNPQPEPPADVDSGFADMMVF